MPAQRGSVVEYFKIIKGETPVNTLLDNVEIGWQKTPDANIENIVNEIIKKYDLSQPEKSVPALVRLYAQI